ncbi:hypothetical protein [Micromonospora sp. NPDC051296]|uniref:hypothetical protein n=1 Tax=Micromonospora sp. NPDC051296 TaxID=3155046 RepID=UPI0034440803
MIEVTKCCGSTAIDDDAGLAVRPGRVTGFIGLDDAGKSTTLRLLRDPIRVIAGTALVDGRRYRDLTYWLGRRRRCWTAPVRCLSVARSLA